MIICKNVVKSPPKCQWYKKTNNSFHNETYNHPFHAQINIHNSDRKGIKYRMSYPRWSISLVVNKQFWSDQSAVDQNETSKRNQLPHDPTTNPGLRSNCLWSHHLHPDTDIRKCTKKSCPLRHKWLHQQNTRMRDKHVNITWVADFRTTEEDKQTRYDE